MQMILRNRRRRRQLRQGPRCSGAKISGAHLLQREQRKQGGRNVHRHHDAEHWNPASGRNLYRGGDWVSE